MDRASLTRQTDRRMRSIIKFIPSFYFGKKQNQQQPNSVIRARVCLARENVQLAHGQQKAL